MFFTKKTPNINYVQILNPDGTPVTLPTSWQLTVSPPATGAVSWQIANTAVSNTVVVTSPIVTPSPSPDSIQQQAAQTKFEIDKEQTVISLDKMRWTNRRWMAWIALAAILVATGCSFFLLPVVKIAALTQVITWFYITMASIIASYLGTAAFTYVATMRGGDGKLFGGKKNNTLSSKFFKTGSGE